jgi:hypothetical protein
MDITAEGKNATQPRRGTECACRAGDEGDGAGAVFIWSRFSAPQTLVPPDDAQFSFVYSTFFIHFQCTKGKLQHFQCPRGSCSI